MSLLRSGSSPPSYQSYSAIFPTYLVPSLPFRRHQSENTSSSPLPTSSQSTATTIEEPESYLGHHVSFLYCLRCSTHFALTAQIVSKGFTGRHGRAYLVSATKFASAIPPFSELPSNNDPNGPYGDLENIYVHRPVERLLVTGAHTVSDISCRECGCVVGWKYIRAEEEGQRYKVGKFILECARVGVGVRWEGEGDVCGQWERFLAPTAKQSDDEKQEEEEEEVEFDSEDEDECEDLFAGVWSKELALGRRKRGRGLMR